MVEEFGQFKIPQQLKKVHFSVQAFAHKTEELSKIREAENFVMKLLETPLDINEFEKIQLPNYKAVEDVITKQ